MLGRLNNRQYFNQHKNAFNSEIFFNIFQKFSLVSYGNHKDVSPYFVIIIAKINHIHHV